METLTTPTALDRIEQAFKGYISPSHEFRNITFDHGSEARLGSIYGFIMGLKLSGNSERAEELAGYFLSHMDRLNNYGPKTDVEYCGDKLEVPYYRVVLGDDGTANSFRIAWMANPKAVHYNTPSEPQTLDVGSFPILRYRYSFNGGLIYHGFNQQTFTTRNSDDSDPWGIHT